MHLTNQQLPNNIGASNQLARAANLFAICFPIFPSIFPALFLFLCKSYFLLMGLALLVFSAFFWYGRGLKWCWRHYTVEEEEGEAGGTKRLGTSGVCVCAVVRCTPGSQPHRGLCVREPSNDPRLLQLKGAAQNNPPCRQPPWVLQCVQCEQGNMQCICDMCSCVCTAFNT